MSEQDDMNVEQANSERLKSRNRATALGLGALVLFLFVVSYFKIDKAVPEGAPVEQAAAGESDQ